MKLISLNIEGNIHFDRIIPFLENERPDVICVQEIFEADMERFTALGYTGTFLPMTQKDLNGTLSLLGIASFSRTEHTTTQSFYYSEPNKGIPIFNKNDIPNSVAYGVILADVSIDGQTFTIGTTHFTWTPNGENPGPEQQTYIKTFIAEMENKKPHVMCGDFNIPRHKSALYPKLIESYTDAVPAHYTSSLDKNIHRLGDSPDAARLFEEFMVDYVFTQSPYVASDVRLEFGISDHAAVVATIEKIDTL